MIRLLLLLSFATLAEEPPRGSASTRPLMEAAEAEVERALEAKLPDSASPYLVTFEAIDGEVATALASFGVVTSYDASPYRNLRAEVRVGDYQRDNTNFNPSFGERGGVVGRGLPHEDVPLALRREMWLAADDAYKGATEQYAAKLSAFEGRTSSAASGGSPLPDLLKIEPLRTDPMKAPSVDGPAVRALVEGLTAPLADYPELEEGDAIARDWQGVRLICSSEGARAWLPTGFAVARVEAVARAADGARLRSSRSWIAKDLASLPPLAEMQAEVREMADWLVALRSAPVEEDYLGPVLFEDEAAVELFRQLLLPEIVGTPPEMETPDPYSDLPAAAPTARLGRRLLPAGWSVVDDPAAHLDAAGGYRYDFEGVPAERVEVVEDGVVRDLLMSRVPRADIRRTNGHGRSLGLDRRVGMPGVVEVTPRRPKSAKKLERKALALAREAGRGYVLVVRRLEPPALAEDFRVAFSGEGPLPGLTRPLEVYRLYPDGRTEPVRGLEFVGVDRRVLREIAVAGRVGEPVSEMDTSPGAGRYSVGSVGGLPVTWSVPAVVIAELELRGSGGSEQRVLEPPPVVPAVTALP